MIEDWVRPHLAQARESLPGASQGNVFEFGDTAMELHAREAFPDAKWWMSVPIIDDGGGQTVASEIPLSKNGLPMYLDLSHPADVLCSFGCLQYDHAWRRSIDTGLLLVAAGGLIVVSVLGKEVSFGLIKDGLPRNHHSIGAGEFRGAFDENLIDIKCHIQDDDAHFLWGRKK